jgi:hypothetical protein
MTLIAFHTEEKRARIMSDSWGYTFNLKMSTTSKHTVLPHLDMAIAAQGSTTFQSLWLGRATLLAQRVSNFDEFLAEAPAELRTVWAELGRDVEDENHRFGAKASVANSVIFHIGYSAQRRRFVAWAYASEQGFNPIDLTDVPYVQPTPVSSRPGPVEGPRLRAHFAHNGISAERLDQLDDLPPLPAPRNRTDWVELAKRVRVDRAECDLWSGLHTNVGGDVHLTTLTPGSAETKRVHHFPDDTESLQRVFAGTLHPISQAGPCALCNSGRRYVDCCLAESYNGRPCPCGGPDPFERCCSILADVNAATVALPV